MKKDKSTVKVTPKTKPSKKLTVNSFPEFNEGLKRLARVKPQGK
jgi:hypothetical protein